MKSLILLISSLLLVACNNQEGDGLNLNNGEKWEVNAEMRPFIEQGDVILTNYLKEGQADYHSLAAALKEQNTKLISSCTMKGKSHDELHKWLHPHMELIEELEDAAHVDEANQITAKLAASFADYKKYFR